MMCSTRRVVLTVFCLLAPSLAAAQISIVLKNKFIETYKNRATIEATFKAHKAPNSPQRTATSTWRAERQRSACRLLLKS